MSRDEIEKLLGGYATDTLTEAERSALFAAALQDQELFDALAKEQALREVLQEPSARRQLMEALLPARQPLGARMWRWLRQPAALALTGGIAALLIVAGIALYQAKHAMTRLATMADVIAPAISVPAPTLPPAVSPPYFAPRTVSRMQKRMVRAAEPQAQAAGRPAASPLPAPPPSPPPALDLGAARDLVERPPRLQAEQNPISSLNAPMARMAAAKSATNTLSKQSLQYTLLRRDSSGAYAPVTSGAIFHAGDSVRLRIDAGEAGYIYLFRRDETAGWNLVASQRAEKGQRYILPAGSLESDVPLKIELMLVFSPTQQLTFTGQPSGGIRITLEYR